jgi:uncharacterized phage infection (PIP) family protein YhgE
MDRKDKNNMEFKPETKKAIGDGIKALVNQPEPEKTLERISDEEIIHIPLNDQDGKPQWSGGSPSLQAVADAQIAAAKAYYEPKLAGLRADYEMKAEEDKAHYEYKIKELRAELEVGNSLTAKLTDKCRDYEAQLAEKDKLIKDLQSDIENYKQLHNDVVTKLQSELSTLKADTRGLLISLERANQSNRDLLTVIKTQKAEREQMIEELENRQIASWIGNPMWLSFKSKYGGR